MLQNLSAMLNDFVEKYLYWVSIPKVNTIDLIEILIISFLIYGILTWAKNTRAWNLLRGIVVILVFCLVAAVFQMNTILWIASKTANVLLIAIVIIFQPEMRRALEQIGRDNPMTAFFNFGSQEKQLRFSEKTLSAICKASFEMAKTKTGALIVIEQDMLLTEYERTGIPLDSLVSTQLLINIFEHNTPLHDGAIIVRGDRILAGTCYLPLSESMNLSKDLGTRHRAAIGTTEVSDALVVVVSEETGAVSVALGGKLFRNLDMENLQRKLSYVQNRSAESERLKNWKRRLWHVKKTSQSSDK